MRGSLVCWQPWGPLCRWGLAAGGKGHFKIWGAFLTAPPCAQGMCWCCCISAYFPWVAKQTRCPDSGRRVRCKWKSKSLLIGNIWFANPNVSELEQIWETPECESQGDQPALQCSSEGQGNLAKDIWAENRAFDPERMFSPLCFTVLYANMWPRGPCCLFLWEPGQTSEWTTLTSVCLSVKWG